MDGVHDMGGHGRLRPSRGRSANAFHADWEKRVFAFQRALGFAGAWVIDDGRHAQELLPPHVYLGSSYFHRWELSIEKNLVDLGYAGTDELKPPAARCVPGKALAAQAHCRAHRAGDSPQGL